MSAGADLDLDLSVECGLEETIPCEHSQHDELPDHHADGNEHYVRAHSPCGHGVQNEVFVVCEKWLLTSDMLSCGDCGVVFYIWEQVTDLGLVSDFHK